MSEKPNPIIIEKLVGFEEDYTEGKPRLVIQHSQDILDDWVSDLKRDKIDADHAPEGEFMKIATIPTIFIEEWAKEGFDINHASAKEIVKRLRDLQLDAFITTNKRV